MSTITLPDEYRAFFYTSDVAAAEAAKAAFDRECVSTCVPSTRNTPIDGCHLYPRDTHPELLTLALNIFPLIPRLHHNASQTFDYVVFPGKERPPRERIVWLLNAAHPDHRQLVRERIEQLEHVREVMGLAA